MKDGEDELLKKLNKSIEKEQYQYIQIPIYCTIINNKKVFDIDSIKENFNQWIAEIERRNSL